MACAHLPEAGSPRQGTDSEESIAVAESWTRQGVLILASEAFQSLTLTPGGVETEKEEGTLPGVSDSGLQKTSMRHHANARSVSKMTGYSCSKGVVSAP
jgi:hypothetical protein